MTNQIITRHSVEVGPGFDKVTPVSWWYRNGTFKSEDEARGAFRLAYVQALDGMGCGIAQWMGLTESEAAEWIHGERLPGNRSSATVMLVPRSIPPPNSVSSELNR